MTRTLLLPIVALSLLLSASPAEARPASSSGTGATTLSLFGVLDPGPDGFGAGLRVGIPVAPQGILHARVRDELVLELGGDFVHYSEHLGSPYWVDYSWNGFALVGGLAWNFWVTPRLALYPKLDLGWWFGSYKGWDPAYGAYYHRHDYAGMFAQGAVGLVYRLSAVDLRLELGTELVRFGVGFRI